MRVQRLIISLLLFLSSVGVLAHEGSFNVRMGVTPTSHNIYYLHMTIFWVCVAIASLVFGVLIFALITHRRSHGRKPDTWHSSLKIELIWSIIPFLILVAMAVPATRVLIHMDDNSDADINIKITGYQWKWKYDYLDQGISFFSNLATTQDQINGLEPKSKWYLLEVDNPVVVPIYKKVRFLVTSNDVVHSWWVPELGVKRDAMPGFIYEAWARIDKPGTYRGQCAELCGVGHGFMPIVVIAKTQADYDAWVAEQKGEKAKKTEDTTKQWTKLELMNLGKQIYNKTCAVCHKPDGSGMPPTFPALAGSKVTTGGVAKHMDTVINGVTGTGMQAFGKQLSDTEIAAVVTYERNSWSNDDTAKHGAQAGGLIQPAQVAEAKGEKPAAPAAKEAAKPAQTATPETSKPTAVPAEATKPAATATQPAPAPKEANKAAGAAIRATQPASVTAPAAPATVNPQQPKTEKGKSL